MESKQQTERSVLLFKFLSPQICLNYECHFLNETGPSPVSFFIHEDFMQNLVCNLLKKVSELFKRLCQGFGFIYPDMIYLKNNTGRLVDRLFQMYSLVFSS